MTSGSAEDGYAVTLLSSWDYRYVNNSGGMEWE